MTSTAKKKMLCPDMTVLAAASVQAALSSRLASTQERQENASTDDR
uniref:Uncharacterized protein n=1 Tax=Zea mays TaxID=4577 RepID=C4J2U2_MAIZE|nr:unknown [Zea mays]ACR37061.1 unknown [Zea mays]